MKNPLENYKDQKVCIIGLGYVGLTLALSMAEVGFVVQGVEVRDEVIDSLNSFRAHFYEPGTTKNLLLKTKDFYIQKIFQAISMPQYM